MIEFSYSNQVKLIGLTVAGSTAPGTIVLSHPAAVLLDADEYLFIVDSSHNRIVASGSNGIPMYNWLHGCFWTRSESIIHTQRDGFR